MDEAVVEGADPGTLGDIPGARAGPDCVDDAFLQGFGMLATRFGRKRPDLAVLGGRKFSGRQVLRSETGPWVARILPSFEAVRQLAEILGQLDFERDQLIAARAGFVCKALAL